LEKSVDVTVYSGCSFDASKSSVYWRSENNFLNLESAESLCD
jgi:hypothetical protein